MPSFIYRDHCSSSQIVLIGGGNYHEVVNVTRQGPLTLLVIRAALAFVIYHAEIYPQGITSQPENWAKNQVHLWNSSYINQTTQISCKSSAQVIDGMEAKLMRKLARSRQRRCRRSDRVS